MRSRIRQIILIFSIGAGLTNVLGRHGAALRSRVGRCSRAMGIFSSWARTTALWGRSKGTPLSPNSMSTSAERASDRRQLEGKEVRFASPIRALLCYHHHRAYCGAVIAMHERLRPLAEWCTLVNIARRASSSGGVGSDFMPARLRHRRHVRRG